MAPIPRDAAHAHGPDLRVPMGVACAFGYLVVGIAVYTCINNYRFKLPKWYAESPRDWRDRALFALYFLGILALWPLILPYLIGKKIVGKWVKIRNKSRTRAVKFVDDEENWSPTRSGNWEEIRLEGGRAAA
ncbi:hypothetical protein CPLU01_11426 [Colletotrichum plurivorum]|uniref:Uncharacterized protein n=1 Tax=Colletotrichum plurivorum TaxID=2175906 RepID=A0A8H6K347_9PEZI|nr:hypothetical protein CPLU01_11426 [Colletotrichum plurivorum]